MNLIEESFQKKEEKKKKRTAGIILGSIIVVILIIIAIVAYLGYLENKQLKVYLDGQLNNAVALFSAYITGVYAFLYL